MEEMDANARFRDANERGLRRYSDQRLLRMPSLLLSL
jgi:hypothetical protein